MSHVPKILALLNYEQWSKGHGSFYTSSPLRSYLIMLSSLQGVSPWATNLTTSITLMLSSFLSPKSFTNHPCHLKWKLTDVTNLQMPDPQALYIFWGKIKTWTVYRHGNIDLHHYQSLFNWPTLWKQIQYLVLSSLFIFIYQKSSVQQLCLIGN